MSVYEFKRFDMEPVRYLLVDHDGDIIMEDFLAVDANEAKDILSYNYDLDALFSANVGLFVSVKTD